MFTLQSLMLVALGILVASLIMIAIMPAYRGRIQRLTAEQIRRSAPLTEAEIRADKDKLRAQYAIRVHKLEAQSEQQKLAAARQRIEMNRRDARITELQDELERLSGALEENVNARRVLEHTVTDRLPRLEQQLESARGLIQDRDEEMAALKSETTRSVRALDDAMQMNAQQRAELQRIGSSVGTRPGEPRYDNDGALRSEVELLRAKTHEQARLLAELQGPNGQGQPVVNGKADKAAGSERGAAEAGAKALTAKIDEQAAEIARLGAALAVYESESESGDSRVAGPASRLSSKAKVSSLQAQVTQQTETIQRLRAELAASNERLARQAAHFMEEMRRLGSGTVPTAVEPRMRRSLSDRIGQARTSTTSDAQGTDSNKVAEYIKALTDETPVPPANTEEPPINGGNEPAKRKPKLLERISSVGKA